MSRQGLIEKYLSELKKEGGNVVDFGDVSTVSADPLEPYKVCMDDKGVIEVEFQVADAMGNLSVVDKNGVTIMLKRDVLSEDLEYYRARIKDRFLANAFTVRVVSIDEENGVVYVRSSRNSEQSSKRRLMDEIRRVLGQGEMPHIAGRVFKVTPNRVYVDVLCKGILGICNVDKWQLGYIRYLEADCQTDAIYDFVITGQVKPIPGKAPAFALSRIPFTKDPWGEVPDSVSAGSVLVIKCLDMPYGKTYWWGKSPVVSGIEIMCDFNDKLHICIGESYKCKVTDFDAEKHVLKAVPFEATNRDITGDDIVTFLNNQRPRGGRRGR